jgi:multiple sugar transport system permease protein
MTERARVRRQLVIAVHVLVSAAIAVVFTLPLIWAVSTSLRTRGTPPPRSIDWVPSPIVWRNYRELFAVVDLDRFIANSLFVAGLAVPITIVAASSAGFAIAQLSRPWRYRLVLFSILALMVPLTAIWLPRFILFKEAGLVNHRLALVVPALMGTSPLYVLLFTWSFLRVPREIYDAARLDGAGPAGVWLHIGLPLARPAVVSVAVLAFVHFWNSFVEPLLLLRTPETMTASLGLRVLYQLDRTDWPIMMAGAVVVTAPVLIVFLVAQRAFFQDELGHSVLAR